EIEDGAGLLENTHDDSLAVKRGHGGETDIDVLAGDLDLDPSVLGEALLGDVELTHDLDPRRDRGVGLLGLANDVVKNAVDPESGDELLLVRLDVDVGGFFLHGPEEQRVHE